MELTLLPNPRQTSNGFDTIWVFFNYQFMTSNKGLRTDKLKVGGLLLSTVFNIFQLLACTTVLSISDLLFFFGCLSFAKLFEDFINRLVCMK